MSTPDPRSGPPTGPAPSGELPCELTLLSTQLPRPGETPSLPAAGSSTPGGALAGARLPGGPSLPDYDPISLTRVVAQLANELFAAPIPAAGAPNLADAGTLTSPPLAASLPTSSNPPFEIGGQGLSPFVAPLDFDAIALPDFIPGADVGG